MIATPFFDPYRILIFGNAGSGKTWLARELGARLKLPVIHLDDLRWEPGYTGIARESQLVADGAARVARAETWLMEGVYGWLAKIVLPRVTTLIWIDLPEDECIANVRERGVQGGNKEAFQELIKWVSEYRLRNNTSCFAAHSQLFEAFAGSKMLLKNRDEIASCLETMSRNSEFCGRDRPK